MMLESEEPSASVIRTGVPLPPARRGVRGAASGKPAERLVIEALRPGQSVEFPAQGGRGARRDYQQRLGALAWQVSKASGGKARFSTRMIYTDAEGWRVGVWRTA